MSSNYETLYGVGLLDDLHNYFPALLYDSSEFASVRDVLRYIQDQARNRFDLFSYGQREYLSTHPPAEPASSDSYQRRVVRTSFSSIPPSLASLHSTLRRGPTGPATSATIPTGPSLIPDTRINAVPMSTVQQFLGRTTGQSVPSIQVELSQILTGEDADNEEEQEETNAPQMDTFLTNALLNLLNLPPTSLARNYVFRPPTMDQFLQPVVVHPTAEQIEANTTVGNLVSDTEHSCAICQDTLTSEQEGRKLNACGHWFHKTCIDTWLAGNVHCPVCRHDIRESMNQPSDETQ